MAIAHSKLTAQGQISVPSQIRKKLGVGPGSILEWEEVGEAVVVRRAGRYSSEDIHAALFEKPRSTQKRGQNLKEGIRTYMRKKHASR
jgi:AbrB family looped-hinge helix DNA binding protein